MQITCRIENIGNGNFMIYCPNMESAITQGITKDKVLKKLISTAKLYVKLHPQFNSHTKILEI